MAKEIEFLCLANSRREGGRCLAGIDLETDKWVRLAKSDGSPFSSSEITAVPLKFVEHHVIC